MAKDNPMLSRPVTSGSLVARNRVEAGVQANSQPVSRPGTAVRTPNRRSRRTVVNRPMTAERRRDRTQSRGSKPNDLSSLPQYPTVPTFEPVVQSATQPISDLQALAPSETQKTVEKKEDAETSQDLAPPIPVDEGLLSLERPVTATTWKTTSSQRRYIDELERLLKEERKVRSK